MSGSISSELVTLNKKLDDLLGKYYELKNSNKDLKSENEILKQHLQERDSEIRDLEVKYERLKISGALMSEGENSLEARRKITELVREIDRCVALLNR